VLAVLYSSNSSVVRRATIGAVALEWIASDVRSELLYQLQESRRDDLRSSSAVVTSDF